MSGHLYDSFFCVLLAGECPGRVDYIFAIDSVYLKPDEVLSLVEQFPPEEVVAPEFEELDIPILKEGGLVVSFDKITCLGK